MCVEISPFLRSAFISPFKSRLSSFPQTHLVDVAATVFFSILIKTIGRITFKFNGFMNGREFICTAQLTFLPNKNHFSPQIKHKSCAGTIIFSPHNVCLLFIFNSMNCDSFWLLLLLPSFLLPYHLIYPFSVPAFPLPLSNRWK